MSPTREPVWRYRADSDGNIEGRLFDYGADVPEGEGWQDSPAKCGAQPKSVPVAPKTATRRKRSIV